MKIWMKLILVLAAVLVVAPVGAVVILRAGGTSEAAEPSSEPPEVAETTTTTTAPATYDASGTLVLEGSDGELLEVFWPHAGDVVSSPLSIAGATTGGEFTLRLFGDGDRLLGEGTSVPDGAGELSFSTTFEFSNDCCTEMTLEITSSDGLTATIPLTYPVEG